MKDRKKEILKIVVTNYIDNGTPMGSKAVVENLQQKLSTATIRNEMAALEEMGYLVQPHISAGRIPSDLAYRFYVDSLMENETLSKDEIQRIKSAFNHECDNIKQVVNDAVKVLSDITNCVAVALLPKSTNLVIKDVKLMLITNNKALVVIVTNHGIIKDRVVKVPEGMTQTELNVISEHIAQKAKTISDLAKIDKSDFLGAVDERQNIVNQIIDIFDAKALEEDNDIIVNGAFNIFNFPDCDDIEKAKSLVKSFENVELLKQVLDKNHHGFLIGGESEIDEIKDCSLITVDYDLGNLGVGSFGIIGPKRMNYAKMLKILETLSDSISFLDLFE